MESTHLPQAFCLLIRQLQFKSAVAMAALAIFDRIPLRDAAAELIAGRALPLRHHLLHYPAIFVVLAASALFYAIADPNHDASNTLAVGGFVLWVGGVVLLLLAFTVGRFPAAARLAAQLAEATVMAFF